jgi:hypothetical protein
VFGRVDLLEEKFMLMKTYIDERMSNNGTSTMKSNIRFPTSEVDSGQDGFSEYHGRHRLYDIIGCLCATSSI